MRVAMTGAGGLIGTAARAELERSGHGIVRLVRGQPSGTDVRWNPEGESDLSALDGIDAAIHLAGENVGSGRWTDARREQIRSSRADGTRRLIEALVRNPRPPRVLVSASAIGWYGLRGGEPVDESAPPGDSFLASVAEAWEGALAPAAAAGIRVVALRFGVVLSPRGGALASMLTPFRLGLGGPLGSGAQIMSWVSLDDAVRAARFALETDRLSGPVNVTAPNAVSNRDFTRALARVLRRPAVVSVPSFAARLLFGRRMADELLLGGVRATPSRLLAAGFEFAHPDLEPALRSMLA